MDNPSDFIAIGHRIGQCPTLRAKSGGGVLVGGIPLATPTVLAETISHYRGINLSNTAVMVSGVYTSDHVRLVQSAVVPTPEALEVGIFGLGRAVQGCCRRRLTYGRGRWA